MVPPKAPGSKGRIPSSLSKVSTLSDGPVTPSARPPKASKLSKIVTFKLNKDDLTKLLSSSPIPRPAHSKPSAKATSKSILSAGQNSAAAALKMEDDASASPLGADDDDSRSSNQQDDSKSPNKGAKREAGAGADDDSKQKSKGTQRKRPKVGEQGRLDGRTAAAKAAGFVPSAHKLGPKANQGAINEKLRALDRTSKPCRKWQKTGFKIKSFTGRVWEVPTWRTPQSRAFGGNADSQDTSKSLSKDNSSENIGSERSPAENGTAHDAAIASSPIAAAA